MGWRVRRSIRIVPGLRINLNKRGWSITAGRRGLHTTINNKGRKTTTVGLPGTGISYQHVSTPKVTGEVKPKQCSRTLGRPLVRAPMIGSGPSRDIRYSFIPRLARDQLDRLSLPQQTHYNRAYATYQAALAEHKLAQSIYDDSIRTGVPFHFNCQFSISEAYEDLTVAAQGVSSVNTVVPASRLLLTLRSPAVLAGLCGLVLIIGIVIGASLH